MGTLPLTEKCGLVPVHLRFPVRRSRLRDYHSGLAVSIDQAFELLPTDGCLHVLAPRKQPPERPRASPWSLCIVAGHPNSASGRTAGSTGGQFEALWAECGGVEVCSN